MKRLLSGIFFLLFLNNCNNTAGKAEVLATVLKGFGRHSYFVSVKVKDGNQYVITNTELYLYFKQKEGFDEKRYQSYMMSVLSNASILTVDTTFLAKFQFNKVDRMEEIVDAAIIFRRYFNKTPENYWLKDGVSDRKKVYLINALFDKNIVSRIDDESGSLIVPYWQFKDEKQ
ncbi:hypothetical protein [Chitinophaga niabensis]|uniref:Uncharacterized protein n=1 Tax=Chitinophaga niabensis TaxID=536979 RepID=A0A1N6KG80_9BACT|nr:hypothetical protein [Chitinophaga niabensis]SIO55571.1 hypothetical protein SAMN04488055_5788 [Chitinophaga niabensis]